MIVEELMYIVFDETNLVQQDQEPKIADEEETTLEKKSAAKLESTTGNQSAKKEIQSTEKAADNNLPKEWIEPKGLSKGNIIGDIEQGVSTRCKLAFFQHVAFVSQIEPKNVMMHCMIVIGLLLCKMNLINSLGMMCVLLFLKLMQ